MSGLSRSIHLTVHIHKDPAAMAERAAHILAAACEEAIADRGIFRIALSGGQTPTPLFRLLAGKDWADRLPWDKMTFYWVDERCVGPDHPDSNYGLARRELLSMVPATHFFRMRGEEDPVEAAVKYEQQIRAEFNLGQHELPRFDFMLLGMGEDGHTASFFPGGDQLAQALDPSGDTWVLPMRAPGAGEPRITLTLPALLKARHLYLHVEGAAKRRVLDQAVSGAGEGVHFPVRCVLQQVASPVRTYWSA